MITTENGSFGANRALDPKRVHIDDSAKVSVFPCAVYYVTPDLELVSISHTVKDILGYEAHELIGRNLLELGILAPEYQDLLKTSLNRILQNKRIPPTTCEFITKHGERRSLQLNAMPIWFEHSLSGIVGAATDITHSIEIEKRIEKKLIQADKMISLGVLVSGVAHEINNPNNFIMLNTPILKEAWDDALPILGRYFQEHGDFKVAGLPYSEFRNEMPHLLAGIEDGSRRIQRIIQDLRDYARVSPEASYRPVQINDVVKKSINLIQSMIKKSTRRFHIRYGTDIPLIKANPQQIEQVIINLIQNACQAVTDRGQKISITTCYDKSDDEVKIIVADEGKGISSKNLARITEPFFTTKPAGQGTGLGLAVSDRILNAHGGKLLVTTQEGKGSTFTVVLPTKQAKGKKRILVVDDEEGFRKSLMDGIKAIGKFDVAAASNGIEACIKIGQYRPDILVLDIMMPGMDGVDVCKILKDNEDFSHIEVVVITGFADPLKIEQLRAMGFHHILKKPFKLEKLLQKIEQLTEA